MPGFRGRLIGGCVNRLNLGQELACTSLPQGCSILAVADALSSNVHLV